MRYFNLEHEIGISSNGEERDSSIGSEDEKSNGPKKDTFSTVYNNLEWMQMKRLYNIFRQIHEDEKNSCFYLRVGI